jgi:O-antigen/teichoic acid export membrane protein
VSDDVARRVAASTAAQVGARVVIGLIGIASIAVLTRYLGAADYGRYTLALAFVAAFGVAADIGLYTILVRELARTPERTSELVGNALTLRAILWVGASGLAAAIAFAVGYEPRVRAAVALAALPMGLGLLQAAVQAVFQARLDMLPVAVAEVSGRAVAFALAVLVAALDLGFYAVLLAAAGGALASLVFTAAAAARRGVDLRPRADRAVWRTLVVAALPLGLSLGLTELYFRADQLIISAFRPIEEVGLYGLAFRVVELAATLPGALLASVFPVLAEGRERGALQAAFDVFVVLGAPLALGGLVLADDVVIAVAGAEFAGAADPLRILLFAIALAFVNGLFGFLLVARDRQRDVLRINLAALAVNLGLNVALVPSLGIEAAAAIGVLSELVILAGSWRYLRPLGEWPGWGLLPKALLAAVVMTLVLWPADGLPLAVLVVLAVAVYGGVLGLTGGLRGLRTLARR